jgi:hypothetical protein
LTVFSRASYTPDVSNPATKHPLLRVLPAACLVWIFWTLIAPPLRPPARLGVDANTLGLPEGPGLRLPRRIRYPSDAPRPSPLRVMAVVGGDKDGDVRPDREPVRLSAPGRPASRRTPHLFPIDLSTRLRC